MEVSELSDLVYLHGKSIYRFCFQLAKNKIDTDDLYQETFLKALELCHKIDKGSNPKNFLISISIGLWKNNCRKYARRHRIAPIDEINEDFKNNYYISNNQSTTEDIVISKELRVMLQIATDNLSDKLRIPLYMYYTEGMSYNDIASALKIPQGTVKSRLSKARKSLRIYLEEKV